MGLEVVKCPNCGAQLQIELGVKTVECLYCESRVVVFDEPGEAQTKCDCEKAGQSSNPNQVDKTIAYTCLALEKAGKKIELIKILHKETGLGLYETKQLADSGEYRNYKLPRYGCSIQEMLTGESEATINPKITEFQASIPVAPKQVKSRTTAGILALLLGSVGAHKFYLGKVGIGLLYLMFTWTFIPSIIAIIEGIGYLNMSNEGFAKKFGVIAK